MAKELQGVAEVESHFGADPYWRAWVSQELREYQSLYFDGCEFTDLSFATVDDQGRGCGVIMASQDSRVDVPKLSNWGIPVLLIADSGVTVDKRFQKLFASAVRASGAERFVLWDTLVDGSINDLTATLLSNHADYRSVAETRFEGVIDLRASEAELRNGLRKSYRNLVNAGENVWTVREYSGDLARHEDFEEFHKLHVEIAGRSTRSQQSWDYQWEMIQRGTAHVVEARSEDKLIGASLFSAAGNGWRYSSSVARRDLFDKPVNHSLMWRAILAAKDGGATNLHVGEVLAAAPATLDPKLRSIMTFKKGFCSDVTLKIEVSVELVG